MYRIRLILLINMLTLGIFHGPLLAQSEDSHMAKRADQRLLMDIKQLTDQRLVTVGDRGHVLVSDDQGDSWRQVVVPTSALLTKLFFIDEKTGWAVGHQQTIIKTQDGGETWSLQYSSDSLDMPALFDLWFENPDKGFAVGAYGLYLSTEDGGKSWNEVYQAELEDMEIGFSHFYSIAQEQKTGHLFMAGELGFLAKSEDLGASWKLLTSPYSGSFFNIQTMPDDSLIIMGLRGNLYRSQDSGSSWKKVETGTISGLQESILLQDQRVLIVGSDGTQLLSKDNGESVELIQRSDRVHLASALSLSPEKLLLVGINGVVNTQLK